MFESIREFWAETMEMPAARWVVWISVLLILIITAIYFAQIFRKLAFGGRPMPDERFNELKQLRDTGVLSDTEYYRARDSLKKPDLEPVKFESDDDGEGEKQAT